jgi:hypothetical protein
MSRGSAPARQVDDDDDDTRPMTHRRTSVAETGVHRPVGVPSSVFDVAKPAKRARVTAPAFDPTKIEVKRAPLPGVRTGLDPAQGVRYQALLDRMKPGDYVELAPILARGLQAYAKKVKVEVALRKLSAEQVGIWRTK